METCICMTLCLWLLFVLVRFDHVFPSTRSLFVLVRFDHVFLSIRSELDSLPWWDCSLPSVVPSAPAQQLAQVKESQMYFPANHVYTHICHGDFMGRGQKSCIQFSLTWDIRKHVWSLWVLLPLLGNYSLRVFFFFFKKLFWKKLFFLF